MADFLSDQWVEELKMFNLNPIKCYESFSNWGLEAESQLAIFYNNIFLG